MKTSLTTAALLLALTPVMALAQSAESGVDVGPDGSGASAGYVGDWGIAKTESRDGLGRALGVGVTRDGIAISHSIGASSGSAGVGHNFNMAIGRDGSHVSHGGVVTSGGNGRVAVGGSGSQQGGGSTATGWGTNTDAWSKSKTRRWGASNQVYPAVEPYTTGQGGTQYKSAVMPSSYGTGQSNSSGGGYRSAVMPQSNRGSGSFNVSKLKSFGFGR